MGNLNIFWPLLSKFLPKIDRFYPKIAKMATFFKIAKNAHFEKVRLITEQ